MYHINDFIAFIKELIQFFDELTQVEKTKLQAAIQNDIPTLEDCMKKEQVELLKFRGMEKRRQTILSSLGWENKTFSEILETAEATYKEELSAIYIKLNSAVKLYRDTFDSAKNVIEVNLHTIEKTLAQLKHQNGEGSSSIYTPDGQFAPPGATGLTNRKI
jgi:hypothetical protein